MDPSEKCVPGALKQHQAEILSELSDDLEGQRL